MLMVYCVQVRKQSCNLERKMGTTRGFSSKEFGVLDSFVLLFQIEVKSSVQIVLFYLKPGTAHVLLDQYYMDGHN